MLRRNKKAEDVYIDYNKGEVELHDKMIAKFEESSGLVVGDYGAFAEAMVGSVTDFQDFVNSEGQ